MIGTMYSHQSLPKAYGGSYGRSARGPGGNSVTIALVVLLVISGGLSLGFLSAKSQMRDMSIQHESVSQELTYTKNHLHHVEAQLASRELDYQHLAAEVHGSNHQQNAQELETLRQQKRMLDQSLAASNDQIAKLKQEIETTNALIEAYKQHLSDEVASHHQREENWLHIQEDWERLEKEMEDEINTLRTQLQIAKLSVPANVHEHHHIPIHINPEPVKHDPIYDHLPPAHDPHQQQQHQHEQHLVASPVPVHQIPTPSAGAHQQQHAQAAAVPVPVAAGQPMQQVPVQPNGVPVQQVNSPVPVHHQQQQQAAGATAPVPPQPPAGAHNRHDPHYDFHNENHHDHEASDWQPNWHQDEYAQYFDHQNHYADYPGWVDDSAQQHQQHQQHPQHAASGDHHAHQQQEVVHAGDWHHQDDSHHFHYEGHHDQQHQQQQQHVPTPAPVQQQTGTWQQQHPPAEAQQHQQEPHHQQHQQQQQHQHHGTDDLSMKLGVAHRRR